MYDARIVSPTPSFTKPFTTVSGEQQSQTVENYYSEPLGHNPKSVYINSPTPSFTKPFTSVENFEYPYEIKPNLSGWVNTDCGYNPDQLQFNLPSNEIVGDCQQTNEMSEYNKNLYTQNIQPDVYTRNEIIEPINSNIGISFTQQFEPLTSSRSDGKGLTYTEHDFRVYNPLVKPPQVQSNVTEYDIYDPRFSGYGTSYRAYNEDVTGQTRFYYDDVDSIKMPNYVSRSNIDFALYADSYGPLTDKNRYGNVNTNNIRALAQDTFLRCSLQQRDELQERLMRKRNSELHQMRKYPMRTFGAKK
jgi:hypothetical protein